MTDALSGAVSLTYDADGNPLSVTDPRNSSFATSYTYNNMDRRTGSSDPLGRPESNQYDGNGNLITFTNRKNQVTTVTNDGFNRPTKVTYGDGSNTAYTYDAGSRLTKAVDSISGTITLTYDTLDRLTQETTPQGTVSYTYDAAGRRTSMTVAGQPVVNYTYDDANRLTQIMQGTSTVTFGYDGASRRTSMTLPNGVRATFGYDAASQLTSIVYKLGTNLIGDLTYTYDAGGNRTQVGGSLARTRLPAALRSVVYDAANQLTQWGATSLAYDAEGNLTSDGTNSYTWDARGQLASISGGASASFQYDPFGRRITRTIGGSTTQFLYDGAQPVQELSGGSPSANLLTGLGMDDVFTRTDAPGPSCPTR